MLRDSVVVVAVVVVSTRPSAKPLAMITMRNLFIHTPIANMAHYSVGARDESHESEASQSSMSCFDNVSPKKVLLRRRFAPFSFALPTS